MSKYPLLELVETTTTYKTLENVQRTSSSNRRVVLRGHSVAASQQYLMATIHYGNITELPYSADYPDTENIYIFAQEKLYEYFSANRMLTGKARQKRYEAYQSLEKYIFNGDYSGFTEALQSMNKVKSKIEIDAEDIELNEGD